MAGEPVGPEGAAEADQASAAPPVGWLPRSAAELFGAGATAEQAYDLLTVDVPADSWIASLETARDTLGCTYFDWLSAVDEPGIGFRVAAYVVALGAPGPGPAVRGLLVRTTVPHDAPTLPTATGVYAGAAWHERETHEMFGIGFTGHPGLAPLLLPDGFEGHPLRKDFVLAARVVKAWPGAKEPGESGTGHGTKRRQMLPPGVPDPNEWGPLKGQLPPAPARPARGARAAGAAAGERPARRTRSATAGSASQRAAGEKATEETSAPVGERPVRRSRSASGGSASQRAAAGAEAGPEASAPVGERPVRRSRSASGGSASQRAAAGAEAGPEASAPTTDRATEPEPSAPAPTSERAPAPESAPAPAHAERAERPRRPAPRTRSSDAPWHHARPARGEEAKPGSEAKQPEPGEPGEPGKPAEPDDSDDQPGGTA
ncbi:NADH-quinone oxidoreductase subunit C [Streptomyces demainii]|uniref:NADH:ubiquinone oxidoreductase subunit C n=1 Tax=Streptomyces demainii TaxID=588122 RepID=A0ABT9KIK5_9ACTN|nr:NADH:ubiquinone oxidoreductase subunit C [Streptomyces demainii]